MCEYGYGHMQQIDSYIRFEMSYKYIFYYKYRSWIKLIRVEPYFMSLKRPIKNRN